VPYTRGSEYSRTAADIINEAKRLAAAGAREVQLLGQNVNAYHGAAPNGHGDYSLADLIKAIADIDGIERIRYTTSHPKDMRDDLVAAHGSVEKLMPFLHLPVQSGSDAILKAMNRKHTRDLYFEWIDKLRAVRPDIAFSSDFIVGFPNETDQDFEDTLDLVRRVGFASCYAFKYSMRVGTPAAAMTGQVPEPIKSARLAALQELLNQQHLAFNQSFTAKIIPVLFEKTGNKEGQLMGRSPWMQSVYVPAKPRLIGQVVPVRITGGYANSLSGEIEIVDA
jgi:tRNA-2-methylthio-N6-dimethylallyladenosine synthase